MDAGGESSSSLKCSHCERQFTTQRSLRCHIKIHNERTLKCCFCDLMYNRTDALFVHALDHVTNGKIDCPVENCSLVVDSMLEGEKHTFADHSVDGAVIVKCKECSETAPTFRKLLYHYTFKHGQLKEFADEMVNKQKEFLRQKKNEQRKGKRTLAEMVAEKKEEVEEVGIVEEAKVEVEDREEDREFRERLAAVIGDGENSDDIIGKLSNLVAEMFPLTSGINEYQCTHCMMSFADAILWMCHLGFHDVEDPFRCTGCERKFENRQTFVIHLSYFAHGAREDVIDWKIPEKNIKVEVEDV